VYFKCILNTVVIPFLQTKQESDGEKRGEELLLIRSQRIAKN